MVGLLTGGWLAADAVVTPRAALGQRSNAAGQGNAAAQRGGEGEGQQNERGRRGRRGRGEGGGPGGRGRGENQANAGNGATVTIAPANPAELARARFTAMDRDGNKMLQGEELGPFRRQMEVLDTNKDNVLTENELVAGFSSGTVGGAGRGGRQGGRGENRNSDDNDNNGNNDNRNNNDNNRNNNDRNNNDNNRNRGNIQSATDKPAPEPAKTLLSTMAGTYRLKSTKETPKDGVRLPSWFTSRDANGDGQLEMKEYAARLTERLYLEFTGRDTNGDGLITAAEAAGR
jgi:hypothetical protein